VGKKDYKNLLGTTAVFILHRTKPLKPSAFPPSRAGGFKPFLESHISCRAVWIASRTALATAVVFYLRSIIELTPSRRMYCLCADKLSARSGRVNKSQDRHIPVVTAM
jgi:hypothetical protein